MELHHRAPAWRHADIDLDYFFATPNGEIASEALNRYEVASALLSPGHFSVPGSNHTAAEQCHRHREDEPDGNTPSDPPRVLIGGASYWL